MNVLVVLPVAVPVAGVAVTIGLMRSVPVQRVVALVCVFGGLVAASIVLARVAADGPYAIHLGGWDASLGIVLVADVTSALLLVTSLATTLTVLVFAMGHRRTDESSGIFHPAFLAMNAGVAMAFLAGDLFNLFVAFEVLLGASFVLITLGASRAQVRTGMTYVVVSLVASALFVTALGLVYASTGTVNLARLAERLPELPAGLHSAIGMLLLVVFGIKAAMFPLAFWLPDSYPAAPAAVSAVFAGLLTKVGVYAIMRTQTLLFPREHAWTLLLVLAALTMVIGVLGAIAQRDMKRILSFHIVSQIGYMLLGIGLFTVAGVAGAIFFLVHQIPVKTSLFLVEGMVEDDTGSSMFDNVSGYRHRSWIAAALFFLAALSLAGLPPFPGFVAKLSLVEAGFAIDQWLVVGVALAVSLLTLFSMTKIWNGVFWGDPAPAMGRPEPSAGRRAMLGATTALVGGLIFLAVVAGPVYRLAEDGARELLRPTAYLDVAGSR